MVQAVLRCGLFGLALAAPLLSDNAELRAQGAVRSLVRGPVVETERVRLRGNVPLRTLGEKDLGAVEGSFDTGHLYLLLKRSAEQEQALTEFLAEVHTPGSAQYHRWLTPEEFGRRFGAADSDIAAVTGWLEGHGLRVEKLQAGRRAIEFSGTVAQVQEALHTSIHRYAAAGRVAYGNATDPEIPATFADVIAGIAPMATAQAKPLLRVAGKTSYNRRTGQGKPEWTYPVSATAEVFEMAPQDFAVEYNVGPAYTAGWNGAGTSIGILSASNVDLSLVAAYQTLFGLPANLPSVVVDGNDPGQNDAATEAYLDVEEAGAVAPGASVVLYASAGTVLTDPLLAAGMRAVEDNQVAVISLSYGTCEASLGAAGNAAWAGLWQQAAAQGISVFVAAGDAGSAGCDDFDTQQFAVSGLQVNGYGSTPYNVAVGGTDFYYSNYAAGGSTLHAQIASYWNTGTNNTPAASLLQAAPEQAWNDPFGLNAADSGVYTPNASTIVAGGGGASSWAVYPATGPPTGYAKPGWQVGTGVPADGVRDLPDVALFAADGANYVYYPICAEPGDCVSTAASGAVQITSVGGTSAAAPAMAAIQALVDQAVGGRQGQVNAVYYALATKTATAGAKPFNDVRVGGNQVPCFAGTSNCVLASSGPANGFYAESGYAAGTGYDRVTGLGSVNVATLIADWPLAAFQPSSTTLSVSPTSLTHGTAVTVSATVMPASGTGTPTGSVALTSNAQVAFANGLGVFPLTAGAGQISMRNLPGGTYQVYANYGGDGVFAASASAAATVTVTQEPTTLAGSGWVLNPLDDLIYPLAAGMSIPYGAEVFLDVQPEGVNEANAGLLATTPATGAVTFTDRVASTSVSATIPLSGGGLAEWAPAGQAVGTHAVSAAYGGDSSYAAATANAVATYTVFKGTTSLVVHPLETSVAAGGTVTVEVQLLSGYLPLNGALPTGSVTMTLGSQSLSVPWSSSGGTGKVVEEAVGRFTNVPAGLLPLAASYAGDANWLGASQTYGAVTSFALKPPPAVTLTAGTTSYMPGQTVLLTGTVTGPSAGPAPTGALQVTWEGGSSSGSAPLQTIAANAAQVAIALPAYLLASGTNELVATFTGDTNYSAQSSAPLAITVNGGDFSVTTSTPTVAVPFGKSATATITVAPLNGYSGTVSVSCTAISGITCTAAATSATVGTGFTDNLTMQVDGTVAAGSFPATVTVTGGGRVHTAQILVVNAPPAATPVFTPPGGNYTTTQTVTISDASPGAIVYYTLDGTTPTATSTVYTGPIMVSTSKTLRAVATAPGYLTSAIATTVYTIQPATATPVITPAGGVFTAAQTVTITDATAGATIYYTTNGTVPTTASTVYTGPITVGATGTVQAIAQAPGNFASAVATANFTISLIAAAPVFSVPGGTYNGPQTVVISDATAGAAIYYTTNGTTPTTASTLYTAPITVNAVTLQAVAIAPGGTLSPVTSATYVLAAAAPTFSPSAGSFVGPATVALATASPGVGIYYTTAGNLPTTSSTKYTAPITVSTTETIRAIAAATGYVQSAVVSSLYTITTTPATPVFTPAGGSYATAQMVTITDATVGATIYYTIDGSTPTTASAVYTAALPVSASETVKTIAVVSGVSSAVATAAYTIQTPAATPVFSPGGGSYTAAQTVTISDATAGATIYYTTNGTVPTTASTVYAAPISVSATQTINAIAVASGYASSAVGTATYTISLPVATTPTFSPSSGIYTAAQTVTVSDATPGATIYYTMNGSTPTTASTVYTGPISVGTTQTINAIAVASGYANSAVATAVYTITLPAAAPVFSVPGGTYNSPQTVAISDATPGATIYYTTNGTTPTTASTVYSTPITVNTVTLQAVAIAPGGSLSPVTSAMYTLAAATPTFAPAAGSYIGTVAVTLATASPGVGIYYTTAGNLPTTSSTKYTVPITVSATQTIKAIAAATGYAQSAVASSLYTISTTPAVPMIAPAGGTYATAQTVTMSDATAGATIYFTLDGTTPNTGSNIYNGPITVSASQTVKAIAVVSGASSAMATATYTIQTPAATPVFSPGAGAYTAAQTVTISDATPGATIYYTTNGTTPTTASTVYAGPISVSTTQTINAIAVASGYANSVVATALYMITLPAAAPMFSVPGGTYNSPQTVTISDASAGAVIYYTLNGTTPTTASTVYTAALAIKAAATLQAVALAPGSSQSPVTSASYTLAAAAPTFSPAAGSYVGSVAVALATVSPGVGIYYTTAGNLPTTSSTRYTAPITVSATQTIKAIAAATGYVQSAVVSSTYTITTAPTIGPKQPVTPGRPNTPGDPEPQPPGDRRRQDKPS